MLAPITSLPVDDPRASRGLFTVSEAAGWLTVPRSTFHSWVYGYERQLSGRHVAGGRPIVLSLPARRGEAAIPFLGLAEGLVLTAFRRGGLSLQRIRPALERLDRELGLCHALANDRLTTDGAEVLYDYGVRHDPGAIGDLVTVRSGQRVFAPIVGEYLRRIRYGTDHWAAQVELPGHAVARVVVNPSMACGQPVLESSGVPVQEVVQRWIAGDSLAELAGRFRIEPAELEDVLRAATRRSAG